MIEVVSVSLGPSRRDRSFVVRLGGEALHVRRIGCDGCYRKALAVISALDGQVGAIGLGGINFGYRLGGMRWPMPGAERLRRAARRTPLLDGSTFKDAVEPQTVGLLPVRSGRALAVSALDRPAVAQALAAAGFAVRVGDAWFALGLPLFPDLAAFRRLARAGMPFLRHLPLRTVYGGRGEKAARSACAFDVVWGEIGLLRRRPVALGGVSLVTSSVRRDDVEWLRCSGVRRVIAASPPVAGEGFGANVWEAAITALAGRLLRGEEFCRAFRDLTGRVGWVVPFDAPHPTG